MESTVINKTKPILVEYADLRNFIRQEKILILQDLVSLKKDYADSIQKTIDTIMSIGKIDSNFTKLKALQANMVIIKETIALGNKYIFPMIYTMQEAKDRRITLKKLLEKNKNNKKESSKITKLLKQIDIEIQQYQQTINNYNSTTSIKVELFVV